MAKVNSFVLYLDTSQQFLNTVKDRLEDDGYITITSPMDITKVNLDGGSAAQANIVRQSETNLFTSLGMAKELLDSDDAGNIGLERSIQVDENYMFVCYRMFERFMNFILISQTGKNGFNLSFIDGTRFNSDVKADKFFSLTQFGYPLEQYVASYLHIEPKDFESLTYYSTVLGLKEKFTLLPSSFTSSNIDKGGEGGAPKKPTAELSDVTINQQNKGTAEKRTQ